MSKNKKKPAFFGGNIAGGFIGAKLTFFDLRERENILNRINAKTTEKDKGLLMVELIENRFGITKEDKERAFKDKMEEFRAESFKPTIVPKQMKKDQINWTRDERGNLASPFRTKREEK